MKTKPLITGSHSKYSTNISFLDILMNIILAFVIMFLLAFLQINEKIVKTPQVESKAEVLVILTWSDYNNDDIDLWMRLPDGQTVNFNTKDMGFAHLERDDRGIGGDIVDLPEGGRKFIRLNKEVLTLRAMVPGRYDVNVQFYNVNEGVMYDEPRVTPVKAPFKGKVTLARINPSYEELDVAEVLMSAPGDEKTAFSFTINDELKIVDITHNPVLFVTKTPFASDGMGHHNDAAGH